MTRLVIDTPSSPAWVPGAAVEVRLVADDVEHSVEGVLVAEPAWSDQVVEWLREALDMTEEWAGLARGVVALRSRMARPEAPSTD